MRAYTDWNCRLLPSMGDLITTPDDAVNAILILKEKFGLSRFCMMPEFDCATDSVASFLMRRENAFSCLKERLPQDVRVTLGVGALVLPGLSEEIGLKKLLLPKTDLLPIRLPFFPSNETAKELNRLLYHVPYRLLFLSFDSYINFYPEEDLLRWIKLPNAAFQFQYSALENPQAIALLKHLLHQNAPIFFGTGINSYGKACYYALDHYLALAARHFNEYERDLMFFPKAHTLRSLR